jgi:hypothetical protein
VPGALFPAKIFDPLATCRYQLLTQALVRYRPAHPIGNALHILRVNQDCRLSRQLRCPILVRGDDGTSTGHSLKEGVWGSFIQGGKYQGLG